VVELIEGDELVYSATSGSITQFLYYRIKMEGSLSGECVKTGEMQYSDNTSVDPRVNSKTCKKIGAASMVIVPLFRKGKCVGVLKLVSNLTRAFSDHDRQTLQLMAGLLGGALGQQLEMEARRRAETHLRYTALHDALTGLPNRQLFYDRLSSTLMRHQRSKQLFAVMYMDIDYFKKINDTYGHKVGDEVLRAFSIRVQSCLRATDTVARLGGDEFAVILDSITTSEAAELVANKILDAMRTEFKCEGHVFTVHTSIGIRIVREGDEHADMLVKQADDALYDAKKSGRNCLSIAEENQDTLDMALAARSLLAEADVMSGRML
jgi:diguanylate cyclase (GGDEF)-like protein